MTINDKEVNDLVKMLEKDMGVKCFVVKGKEKEMTDEEREKGK